MKDRHRKNQLCIYFLYSLQNKKVAYREKNVTWKKITRPNCRCYCCYCFIVILHVLSDERRRNSVYLLIHQIRDRISWVPV